ATHHERGIEVFRDCQMAAMKAQAGVRGASKIREKEARTGQNELFESVYEMTPDDMAWRLAEEKTRAAELVLALSPTAPGSIPYKALWANVLAKHAVRKPDVNKMCTEMKKSGALIFPDWAEGTRKRVPEDHDRVQRP